jgi:hypothetical protein
MFAAQLDARSPDPSKQVRIEASSATSLQPKHTSQLHQPIL